MQSNKYLYLALGALALLVVVVGGVVYYQSYRDDQMVVAPYNETIDRPDINLAFTYPGGEYGLSLIEPPLPEGGDLLQAFILVPADDYDEFTQNTDGQQSPPAISIFVFNLPELPVVANADSGEEPDRITLLREWATEKSSITSYPSAVDTATVEEIDGLEVLHYRAMGLHQQEIYLASYKGRAYMFVAQFDSEQAATFTNFQQLMSSVLFN